MNINTKNIKLIFAVVLEFITGFISWVCLGISVIFYRIDLDAAHNIAPFVLLSSIIFSIIYLLIVYKRRIVAKNNLKSALFSIAGTLLVSWMFLWEEVSVQVRQFI